MSGDSRVEEVDRRRTSIVTHKVETDLFNLGSVRGHPQLRYCSRLDERAFCNCL